MPIFSRTSFGLARCSAVALALLALSPLSSPAQQPQPPKKELSEKVSEQLANIRTQSEAKNYDGAIAIIDSLLRTVAPDSYDVALLNQIKAQLLLGKGDYAKSIKPLEVTLAAADRHGFFEQRSVQEMVFLLAQLYTQETTTTKDPALLKQYFSKATSYIERWMKNNPKPDPEKQMFLTQILYMQSQLDPANIDMAMIKRVREEAEKGLSMTPNPKEAFYVLLLYAIQQQGDNVRAADLLEILVRNYPKNKQYWQQLAATYLNLQQDLRAALTIERAQQHDTMNSPRDYFNLIGIYFNMQQYEIVVDLLSKYLKEGLVEREQKNYELLIAALQQLKKELAAIDVLKEAIQLFPESGSLYLMTAQIYYSIDKLEDAYKYAKQAVSKKLDKPGNGLTFFAYICFELKKLDEAVAAVNKALEYPDSVNEAKRLQKAIEEAVKEREAALQPSTPTSPSKSK